MSRRMFYAAAIAILAAAMPIVAEDFSDVNGASKWKVYDFNRSGRAFLSRVADFAPSGGIGFDFLFTPDTALLTTDHPSYAGTLLGDLSNKTLTATIKLNVTPLTQFQYFGEGTPQNPCGTPASVRFYFTGNTQGKFEFTKFWWSNPVSVQLQTLTAGAPATISVQVNPALWSDWNGQFGGTVPAGFSAAAQDVRMLGLSFGGGCFFENGVGIVPGTGSGSFQLVSISAN